MSGTVIMTMVMTTTMIVIVTVMMVVVVMQMQMAMLMLGEAQDQLLFTCALPLHRLLNVQSSR